MNIDHSFSSRFHLFLGRFKFSLNDYTMFRPNAYNFLYLSLLFDTYIYIYIMCILLGESSYFYHHHHILCDDDLVYLKFFFLCFRLLKRNVFFTILLSVRERRRSLMLTISMTTANHYSSETDDVFVNGLCLSNRIDLFFVCLFICRNIETVASSSSCSSTTTRISFEYTNKTDSMSSSSSTSRCQSNC